MGINDIPLIFIQNPGKSMKNINFPKSQGNSLANQFLQISKTRKYIGKPMKCNKNLHTKEQDLFSLKKNLNKKQCCSRK